MTLTSGSEHTYGFRDLEVESTPSTRQPFQLMITPTAASILSFSSALSVDSGTTTPPQLSTDLESPELATTSSSFPTNTSSSFLTNTTVAVDPTILSFHLHSCSISASILWKLSAITFSQSKPPSSGDFSFFTCIATYL